MINTCTCCDHLFLVMWHKRDANTQTVTGRIYFVVSFLYFECSSFKRFEKDSSLNFLFVLRLCLSSQAEVCYVHPYTLIEWPVSSLLPVLPSFHIFLTQFSFSPSLPILSHFLTFSFWLCKLHFKSDHLLVQLCLFFNQLCTSPGYLYHFSLGLMKQVVVPALFVASQVGAVKAVGFAVELRCMLLLSLWIFPFIHPLFCLRGSHLPNWAMVYMPSLLTSAVAKHRTNIITEIV